MNIKSEKMPGKKKILIATSALLIDRMLIYSTFADRIKNEADVTIWAASKANNSTASVWDQVDLKVEAYPHVVPYKIFPYTYMRRLNEAIWDNKQKIPGRLTMNKFNTKRDGRFSKKVVNVTGKILSYLNIHNFTERFVERVIINNHSRSPEAAKRLLELNPDVVLITSPIWWVDPAVVVEAKRLGIPVLTMIPSWDNLSTKARLLYRYDGFLLWSGELERQLLEYYPYTRNVPIYKTGAPQFDVFFKEEFFITKEEFCSHYGLDPSKPIILYALGSPGFFKEDDGAVEFAKRVENNEMGDIQVIVRPHPVHNNSLLSSKFAGFKSKIVVQETANNSIQSEQRSMEVWQVKEWVNTFRHIDLVIQLSSTVSIDASFFDKPVINVAFDPEIGQPNKETLDDINHKWVHFKPIFESGAIRNVNNYDEMVEWVNIYLANPSLDSENRKNILTFVCGYIDGHCGERVAEAIFTFLNSQEEIKSKKRHIKV